MFEIFVVTAVEIRSYKTSIEASILAEMFKNDIEVSNTKRILYFSHLKTIIGRGEVFCALTPFSI